MTTLLATLLPGIAVPSAAMPAIVILLKLTFVLLVARGVTLAMPRAAAGSRHLVWLVAFGALLVLPALSLWAPLPIAVLPEATGTARTLAPEESAVPPAGGDARTTATAPSGTNPAERESRSFDPSWSGGTLVLGIWALVALGLAGRLVYGAWSVRRIVRRSRPLEHPEWQTPLYEIADRLALDAAPRLLRSEDVKMPFAAGMFSSTIVLPAESDGWSAERRTAVLIHELGHVRRRDLIGHTLSRLACAVYWFHPLVWTAARQLRAESERACDDLALDFGARPSEYAEHLLDIVTCVRDHNTPAVALAMAHRREFEGRMLAILNPELRRRSPSRIETVSLVSSLAVLTLLVGAASPVPRASRDARSTPPTVADSHLPSDGAIQQPVASPIAPMTPRQAMKPAADPKPNAEPHSAQQPDDERAAVLARTLRTDTDAGVRRVAAWGLRRYAQVDVALLALVAAVGGDANAEVREMAAWALEAARRNPTAGAALVKAIRQDKDASVRATAVWAAGSTGGAATVDALVGVLADPDAEVRALAAWAIGGCRPELAPAALVRGLADKDRDVRLSTAWALYQIRDPETTTAIDAAFQHEADPEVRDGLIKALAQMGDRSVEALQRLVTAPDSSVRRVAVTALAGGSAVGPWPWPRPRPRPFP